LLYRATTVTSLRLLNPLPRLPLLPRLLLPPRLPLPPSKTALPATTTTEGTKVPARSTLTFPLLEKTPRRIAVRFFVLLPARQRKDIEGFTSETKPD
jgi:hypothetical protein